MVVDLILAMLVLYLIGVVGSVFYIIFLYNIFFK